MLPVSEIRRRLRETDPKYHHTLILRSLSVLLSFIGWILFAASIGPWNNNFFHQAGPNRGDWQDGLMIAPLLIAFLFSTFSLLVLLTRQTYLPPLLSLVIDFLIWALLVPAITFATWGGLFRAWRPAIPNRNGSVTCNLLNSFARECAPVLYSIGGMELAGIVFGCFVWLLHVTLFIISILQLRRGSSYSTRNVRPRIGGPRGFYPVTSPPGSSWDQQDRGRDKEMGGLKRPGAVAVASRNQFA